MGATGTIQYRGGNPRGLAKQATEAAGGGLQEAAETWHREMMPGHFEVAGFSRYRYTPRKGQNEGPRLTITRADGLTTSRANPHYYWRKIRQKKHARPLVWSGQSRSDAMGSVRLSVVRRGGSIEARAVMNVPGYFYKYRKDFRPDPIDKADELTRVAADEVLKLRDIVERSAAARFANPPATAGAPSTTNV